MRIPKGTLPMSKKTNVELKTPRDGGADIDSKTKPWHPTPPHSIRRSVALLWLLLWLPQGFSATVTFRGASNPNNYTYFDTTCGCINCFSGYEVHFNGVTVGYAGNNCCNLDWPSFTQVGTNTVRLGLTYTATVELTNGVGFCQSDVLFGPACYDIFIDGTNSFEGSAPQWYGNGSSGITLVQFGVRFEAKNILFTWDNLTKKDGRCQMQADGVSQAIPSTNISGAALTWTIVTNELYGDLGCSLNPQTGIITAGTNEGTIMVEACDSAGGCCYNAFLDLAACSSCESGNCASAANESVDFKIGLGWSLLGNTAGFLQIKEEQPSLQLTTPQRLRYDFQRADVEKLLDSSGWVKQVKAPECLANIVTNSASKYTIGLYSLTNVLAKTNGLYPVTNSPYATVAIENLNGDTNQVRITQARDGGTNVFDYAWQTNGWALTSGGGLRTETRATVLSQTNTVRTVTTTVKQGNNPVVFQKVETYQTFSYGERLIQEVTGSGANALTNSYVYTTNGYLQQVSRSDGSWEFYFYDSYNRPTQVYSSFQNQTVTTNGSLCRLVDYSYSATASGDDGHLAWTTPRRTITSVLGKEIGRSYFVALPGQRQEISCQTAGVSLGASDNLTNITQLYTNGFHQNEPLSVQRSDGRIDIYSYGAISASTTNLVLTGHPDGSGTNIDQGTQTILVYDGVGKLMGRTVVDIPSTIVISQESYAYDAYRRLTQTTYLDGTSTQTSFDCCNASSTTDRDGTVTSFGFDALRRLLTTTRNGITVSNVYDANANVLAAVRFGTNGSAITLSQAAFDDAGRQTSSTDGVGNVTGYAYSLDAIGQALKITTLPTNSATITNIYFRDGSLHEVSGPAAYPIRYTNIVEQENHEDRVAQIETRIGNGNSLNQWTKTYFDPVNRPYLTVYAAASGSPSSQSFFNSKGQLWKTVDPDGVAMLYAYNLKGEMEYTVVDMDQDDVIDFGQTDRITRTVTDVLVNGPGFPVRRTRTFVWSTNSSTVSNLISSVETSVDGLRTWNIIYNGGIGITNAVAIAYDPGNGYRYQTNTAPNGSYDISVTRYGLLQSITQYDSSGSPIGGTSHGYDAHGRQNSITDIRNGTTTYYFDNADRVTATLTPAPNSVQSGQLTTNYSDSLGRIWRTVLPDGGAVTNEYLLTGELTKTYGARTYPLQYGYDLQGRMTNMTTWTNFASSLGAATTRWLYDAYRGFMTNKLYADGNGPAYTFTDAGRLSDRIWERTFVDHNHTYNITATSAYNNAGDLAQISYNESTPAVSYGYDRRGRLVATTNGTQICALILNDAGQLLSESYSGGPLSGLLVTNTYDPYLRRITNAVFNGSTLLSATAYGYDLASRLSGVTNGTESASYSYVANSPLVAQIDFRQNGTLRMSTVKQYDLLNRLTNVASASVAHAYGYNTANQRTTISREDGSQWRYGYDPIGQVTSGKKYWSDGSVVPGQQFEYGFDDIGNRLSAKTGGGPFGTDLRIGSYTNNNLNQVTGRSVPGFAEVSGAANASATVTVYSPPTTNPVSYRKEEYYRAEVVITNSAAVAYQPLTNLAVLKQGTNADIVATNIGNFLLAKTPEIFLYDADGNLVSDGFWTNVWDAESRLVSMTNLTAVPSTIRKRLEFTYDYLGRRVQKVVSVWTNSAYSPQSTNRFLYDGWNVVAELNYTNGLIRRYIWGSDIIGTMRNAGGVGGLLIVAQPSTLTNFVAVDGNGNVTALANSANGGVTATYEYGPFGELIRKDGVMANANPFRFSTKYQDDEGGFCYYGYRYYNPSTGAWLSRDPIGEGGGLCLTGFLRNDGLNSWDILGLSDPYYVLNWHHLADVAVFEGSEGNPSYISTRGIKLAEGVDIHKVEYGVMLRAGDHTRTPKAGTEFTGGVHNEGWSRAWKQWVDTLPKNTVITEEMINSQIGNMLKIDRFAKLIAKGSKPLFNSYQDWLAHLERQRQMSSTRTRRPGGKLNCQSAMLLGVDLVQFYFTGRDAAEAANDANPFVTFDTAGDMFGIGYTSEPLFYSPFGHPSRFRRKTGYFIIYFTGPRMDLNYPITPEVFKIIEKQMKEDNSTFDQITRPGA